MKKKMRTAFIITPHDLFESALLVEETGQELVRNGYGRCVIIDRTLASYPSWHRALSPLSITVVPGLRRKGTYYIARNGEGLRALLNFTSEPSRELITVSGEPRNYGPSSNPIWESRYTRGKRRRFEVYASLKGPVPREDFQLPSLEGGERDESLEKLLGELPDSFDPPIYEHRFPERASGEEFSKLLRARLEEKVKGAARPEYALRLEREEEAIQSKGLTDYFLTVAKVVALAGGIDCWVGPGRGSAVGSLVSYLLGITKVDPLKEGLYFERFLSAGRPDPPDIDIDVEDLGRPALLGELRDHFGSDRFCLIRTSSTFTFRAAARELGRRRKINEARVTRLIDWSREGTRFPSTFKGEREMESLYEDANDLKGLYSGHSVHAAGIIISEDPLKERIPLDSSGQFTLSLWDGRSLETVGMQKIDLLGLRNLTLLKRLTQGREPWGYSSEDGATYEVLGRGHTGGIFQLEGAYATRIVKSIKPASLSDVSLAIALNRPGPIRSGITQRYLKLTRLPGESERLRTRVPPSLSQTRGLLVYQEQVLDIAVKELALSADEGETLRRALSKKDTNRVKEILAASPAYRELPPQRRDKLYSFLSNFAGYAFNKSHSLSYALIAYWLGYFKANRPDKFYGELLRGNSTTDLVRVLAEARERGMVVSNEDSRAGESQGGNRLRLDLPELLGYPFLAQEPGEETFFSFVRNHRSRLQPRDLERLIKSGYLDGYGTRKELLRQINDALAGIDPELKSVRTVFGFREESRQSEEKDSPLEKILMELEVLGVNVGFLERPDLEGTGEGVDFSLTSAVAGLRTGVVAFARIDAPGKSYITDGRTFVRIGENCPLQGYARFRDGRPSGVIEKIAGVTRTLYGAVDPQFLRDASPREKVIIKLKGETKVLKGRKLAGIEPDEVELA